MSGSRGTLERLARQLVAALEPLRRAVGDEHAFRALMRRLGWDTAGLPAEYTSVGEAIAEAARAADALGDTPAPAAIADLLSRARTAYDAVRGIAVAPPGVDAETFLTEIGEQLFEILLTDYLSAEQPEAFNLLSALGVIEMEDIPSTAQRPGYVRPRIKWQDIPTIVTDPASLPARVYGWGTPRLRFHLLIEHLAELLSALGFPVTIGPVSRLLADGYHDSAEGLDETAWALKIPFYYITIANRNLEAAFTLMELKGEGGALPGVIVEPQVPEEFPLTFHLAPAIDLRLQPGTNTASHFGILLRPGDSSIRYPFEPGKAPPAAGIGIGLDFRPESPTLLFGAPGGTRLEVKGASLDFMAKVREDGLDVRAGAQLEGLALVLAGGETDSFLQSFAGRGDSRIEIPLGIEWSRRDGVRFSGADAFEVTPASGPAAGTARRRLGRAASLCPHR